jgi:hypothetical protein
MNNSHPESLLVIAKQKTQEAVDNCLAWQLCIRFLPGGWMAASYVGPSQTDRLIFITGQD